MKILKNIILYFFVGIISFTNLSWNSSGKGSADPIIEKFETFSVDLYEKLNEKDLSFNAFNTGLKGFLKLRTENKLDNLKYLTIIDMSVSSNQDRFFLIDIDAEKIVHKSIVAHGRNSGNEFAKIFSNKIGSFQSSLGFYKTAETYHGKHGLSLRLDGLEHSNNNARKRAIVIHSADYVSNIFIDKNGRLGRSLGCPSLPKKDFSKIIEKIKNGSVLFIYYPKEKYLETSILANSNNNYYFKKEIDISPADQ